MEARITIDPEVRGGKPIIRGTRITVVDMLEYMAGGMSIDEILADFPGLTAEDLRAVLAFTAGRERRRFAPAPPDHPAGLLDIVTIDPAVMSGAPVFTTTHVPVESLIQHLSAGASLDDYLAGFPGVSREQATGFLRLSFQTAIASIPR